MGLDVERFVQLTEEIKEDVICSICRGVFQTPMLTQCQHVFCYECIQTWIEFAPEARCPLCNLTFKFKDIKPASKYKDIVDCLVIQCDYKKFGCDALMSASELDQHKKCCKFKPNESRIMRFMKSKSRINVQSGQIWFTTIDMEMMNENQCEAVTRGQSSYLSTFLKLVTILVLYIYSTATVTVGITFHDECRSAPLIPLLITLIGFSAFASTTVYICNHFCCNTKAISVISGFEFVYVVCCIALFVEMYNKMKLPFQLAPLLMTGCNQFLIIYCIWVVNVTLVASSVALIVIFVRFLL